MSGTDRIRPSYVNVVGENGQIAPWATESTIKNIAESAGISNDLLLQIIKTSTTSDQKIITELKNAIDSAKRGIVASNTTPAKKRSEQAKVKSATSPRDHRLEAATADLKYALKSSIGAVLATDPSSFFKGMKSVTDSVGGAASNLSQSLVGVNGKAGVLRTSFAMLARGTTDVFKSMGMVLAVVGPAVSRSMDLINRYSADLDVGSTFSITEMITNAEKLGISTNQYSELVQKNSGVFAALGSKSVNGVIQQFDKLTAAGSELNMLWPDSIQGMMEYNELLRVTGNLRGKSDRDVATGAKAYLTNLVKLSQITGTSVKEQEKAILAQAQNAKLQAMMATLPLEEQARITRLTGQLIAAGLPGEAKMVEIAALERGTGLPLMATNEQTQGLLTMPGGRDMLIAAASASSAAASHEIIKAYTSTAAFRQSPQLAVGARTGYGGTGVAFYAALAELYSEGRRDFSAPKPGVAPGEPGATNVTAADLKMASDVWRNIAKISTILDIGSLSIAETVLPLLNSSMAAFIKQIDNAAEAFKRFQTPSSVDIPTTWQGTIGHYFEQLGTWFAAHPLAEIASVVMIQPVMSWITSGIKTLWTSMFATVAEGTGAAVAGTLASGTFGATVLRVFGRVAVPLAGGLAVHELDSNDTIGRWADTHSETMANLDARIHSATGGRVGTSQSTIDQWNKEKAVSDLDNKLTGALSRQQRLQQRLTDPRLIHPEGLNAELEKQKTLIASIQIELAAAKAKLVAPSTPTPTHGTTPDVTLEEKQAAIAKAEADRQAAIVAADNAATAMRTTSSQRTIKSPEDFYNKSIEMLRDLVSLSIDLCEKIDVLNHVTTSGTDSVVRAVKHSNNYTVNG